PLPRGSQPKLGPILVKAGLLRPEDLPRLQAAQQAGEDFAATVIRITRLSEEQVAQELARFYSLPFVRLAAASFDPRALALMSEPQASRYHAIPVTLDDDGTLVLAASDPVDYRAKEA